MSEHFLKARKLNLDQDNGWILGVCAGLANYLKTDYAVVRVATVVAALFAPKIVVATYLVAWLVLDRGTTLRR